MLPPQMDTLRRRMIEDGSKLEGELQLTEFVRSYRHQLQQLLLSLTDEQEDRIRQIVRSNANESKSVASGMISQATDLRALRQVIEQDLVRHIEHQNMRMREQIASEVVAWNKTVSVYISTYFEAVREVIRSMQDSGRLKDVSFAAEDALATLSEVNLNTAIAMTRTDSIAGYSTLQEISGVGTAIGGVIGGTIGGLIGALVGGIAATWFGPSIDDRKEKINRDLQQQLSTAYGEVETFAPKLIGDSLKSATSVTDEYIETFAQLVNRLPIKYEDVLFTSYYPRSVLPERRYSLFLYIHTSESVDAITQDVVRFERELGDELPHPKRAKTSARLRIGTVVTAIPECKDLDFSPKTLEKTWDGDWVRYEFEFRANPLLVGETLICRISVQVDGIEISQLTFALEVNAPSPNIAVVASSNPLAIAKQAEVEGKATSRVFNRIFISYSRKDKIIAERYRLAQIAIGNDVFLDTESIRAGENWRLALAKAIDNADILQLFWSENSAHSQSVRDEWEYALKHRCPDTQCATFIRPVYWKDPIPVVPPPELAHLNFKYVPFPDE